MARWVLIDIDSRPRPEFVPGHWLSRTPVSRPLAPPVPRFMLLKMRHLGSSNFPIRGAPG